MTPRLYWEELSDHDLFEVYLAPRDEDHYLIPQRQRRSAEGQIGSIERAAQELPSAARLGLSEQQLQEVLAVNPRVGCEYALMFWQVWRGRGLSVEETMTRWRERVADGNPRRHPEAD